MDEEIEPEIGTPEWFRFAVSHHMRNGRCSSCLIGQLVTGYKSRDLDFNAVADEIGLLENHQTARRTNTKPAAPFKKGRLRGFCHKHFFQSSFMMKNIGDYWINPCNGSGPKLDKLIQKTLSDPEIPDNLNINFIIHQFVIGGLERRSRESALTGEWIIYKRHNVRNYYLTLAAHTESEDRIIERIKSCAVEFPELVSILNGL